MFGGNPCPIARWAGKANAALESQNGGKRRIAVDRSHLQFSKYVLKPGFLNKEALCKFWHRRYSWRARQILCGLRW